MCQYAVIATHMFRRTLDYPVPYSYLQRVSSPVPTRKAKADIKKVSNGDTKGDYLSVPGKIEIEPEICKACNLAIHGESIWEDDFADEN